MAAFRKRGGKWQARVKKDGHTIEKTFVIKADAERWARKIEVELEGRALRKESVAHRFTLAEALVRYSREFTPRKRGAAIELVRIRALSQHPLAPRALSTIRPTDIARYRDQRLQAGMSASTLAKELGLLSSVFKVAHAEWGMDDLVNPVTGIMRPRQPPGRNRRLLPGEEQALLAAFEEGPESDQSTLSATLNPFVRPVLILAIETGMRRGELLSLRWEHVDLNKCVAHLVITKNGASRDVPLSPRVVQTLGCVPRSACGRVFPMSANALKLAFKRGLKRARRLYELNNATPDKRAFVDLRFHDLRHEATSRFASIFQVHELARITGHRDLKMLLRYVHPDAEHLAHRLGQAIDLQSAPSYDSPTSRTTLKVR